MKILISCLFLILSCQKNIQNRPKMDNEILTNTTTFPNGKVAYKKENNAISFYNPNGMLVAKTDTETKQLYVFNNRLFDTYYKLKLHEFLYFNPSKYYTHYTFPTGRVGTAGGNFSTVIKYNELELVTSLTIETPDGEYAYNYSYNKYGQLLKIEEDKWIDKTILENTYNKEGYLIEQEKDEDEFHSKSTFFYDKSNNVIKEIEKVKVRNSKDTFIWKYEYDKAGCLTKKYTSDYSKVETRRYDDNGLLIRKLVYEVNPDTSIPTEIVQHFTEHNYIYDENTNLTKETTNYRDYTRTGTRINNEWIDLSIEDQKKLGWEDYNKNDIFFMHSDIKSYNYPNNKIVSSQYQKYSYTSNNKKYRKKEENVYEFIKKKYYYNKLNQIIKVETLNNANEIIESKEYSY